MIPAILYMLACTGLFAVAVVFHFQIRSLSLPVEPIVSILTIILPLVSFVNAFVYPSLLRFARSSSRLRQIIAKVLQGLQAIFTTVLATLLFGTADPSAWSDCALEKRWMDMFKAHDASAIKHIQDMLNCCGFNSLKDRAYPFPTGNASTCSNIYDRIDSCKGPWKEALQTYSGVDFAVVLGVAFTQILGLMLMREGTNWWTAWRTERLVTPVTRPLLGAPNADETSERREGRSQSYGATGEGPRL